MLKKYQIIISGNFLFTYYSQNYYKHHTIDFILVTDTHIEIVQLQTDHAASVLNM